MAESEFISADNLTLHTLKGKPSPNVEGAKEIKIKKGDKIPEDFISLFIMKNRDYISNLKVVDGIPQLTKEQEKQYGIHFEIPKPQTEREVVDKAYGKYDMEKLKQKVAKLGSKEFKEWAEKKFGEDVIDKRKSADNIIVQILNDQDGVPQ